MTNFEMLLRMADDPRYAERVPFTFIAASNFGDLAQDIQKRGWEMFKRLRRIITLDEVRAEIQKVQA